jgi:hypothetical protein
MKQWRVENQINVHLSLMADDLLLTLTGAYLPQTIRNPQFSPMGAFAPVMFNYFLAQGGALAAGG